MTREEAIKMVQAHKFPKPTEEWQMLNNEAIDMAIEALSAPSGDLISRADAIEAWDKLSKRGRTEFDQVLMTLPSAEYSKLLQTTLNGDLISRADAIKAMEARIKWFNGDAIEDRCKRDAFIQALDRITELPSADVVQGEWILVKGSNGKDYHKCSKCLHTQEITGVKNYCAVCGARMKGGAE